MEYIYGKGIEHRDLKAENCLVVIENGQYRAKITDFGLSKSKILVTQSTGRTLANGASGTANHMAPELLLSNSNESFCEESDVYSYGIVMYEVLSREVAFKGLNVTQIIAQISQRNRPSPIPTDSPAALITLMEECWAHDTAMRPKFERVLEDLRSTAEDMNLGSVTLSSPPPLPPVSHFTRVLRIYSVVSNAWYR